MTATKRPSGSGAGAVAAAGAAGWELAVDVTLANDGAAAAVPGSVIVSLMSSDGTQTLAEGELSLNEPLAAGTTITASVMLALPPGSVAQWDAEHPFL